ncbi:hypothetical protein LSAT2_015174 [Lamellibrachia satsuma]|nr:hypothetical protein LSAT2_015174 [Lamellibrachia satsuma]
MKGNLVDSGTRIFVRIFQVGPRIREVFNYMLKDGKELADKDALQMHALRFMQAIDTAVEDLDDLDRQVAPMFVNLGRRHIHFKGLEEGDFDGFTGAIMYVFSQDIGDNFKPDVRIAWGRLLDFLILHLKFGFVMARNAAVAKEQGGSG